MSTAPISVLCILFTFIVVQTTFTVFIHFYIKLILIALGRFGPLVAVLITSFEKSEVKLKISVAVIAIYQLPL
jgi:hypothetical protein